MLERTLVNGADLVTALSERRESLASLVGNANEATGALARQKGALAESIELLPPVMRRANTSFLNLRATLDDLDPLVADAKPAARNLSPLLADARAVAAAARPTLRDLRSAIRRPGRGNDAVEVVRAVPALADIAVVRKRRAISPGGRRVSVGETDGAFPKAADAFGAATPVIAFARPYSMDFVGWLDDFSSTGGYFDALGGQTRTHVNIAENIYGTPPKTGQFKRCPGGADIVLPDRSNVLSAEEQRRARVHRGPQGGAMRRLVTVPLVVLAAAAAGVRARGRRRWRGRQAQLPDRVRQRLRPGERRRLPRGRRAGRADLGLRREDRRAPARPRRWSRPG